MKAPVKWFDDFLESILIPGTQSRSSERSAMAVIEGYRTGFN